MNQPKLLINHLEKIKEAYKKHMIEVNMSTKDLFKNSYITYKKSTGEFDEEEKIMYEIKEARVIDTVITSDHDIMFEIIDKEDNLDIIFSFNIVEIKGR